MSHTLYLYIMQIDLAMIKPWVAKKTEEYLGIEDEVLCNFVISELENKNSDGNVSPKNMTIKLTGIYIKLQKID